MRVTGRVVFFTCDVQCLRGPETVIWIEIELSVIKQFNIYVKYYLDCTDGQMDFICPQDRR